MADVGVAASMVTAILETGGYINQSYFLDQLTPVFKGSAGGFIYLIGVVVAIFSVAIRGRYVLASWLLIGPALFFSMILPRSETENAKWEFAKVAREQAFVDDEVRNMIEKEGGQLQPMNVSTFFMKYNKLVSRTVQEMIAVINSRRKDMDKMFIFKGQVYGQLFAGYVERTSLVGFIHDALFSECGEFISAAGVAEDDKATAAQKAVANKFLENFKTRRTVALSNQATAYLVELSAGSEQLTMEEFQKRVDQQKGVNRYTCEEIWKIAYAGLIDYGTHVAQEIEGVARANDIDTAVFLAEIHSAATGLETGDTAQQINDLGKVVAKFLLRNEFFRQSNANMISRRADAQRQSPEIEMKLEQEMMQTEAARIASGEWTEKTRMLNAASNLPYYQGLGLYFLASVFPFFALLLLVPGKHPGFILWFVLWLWLKAWDIGFAVVMLLDDVLFSLFTVHKIPEAGKTFLPESFNQAMYALRISDPTFQMGTYYTILAVAVMGIPVITSQVLLGSLTGGAGLVSAGITQAADYMGRGAAAAFGQTPATGLKQQMWDNKMDRALARQDARSGRVPLSRGERRSFASASNEDRAATMKRFLEANGSAPPNRTGSGDSHPAQLRMNPSNGRHAMLEATNDKYSRAKYGLAPVAGLAAAASSPDVLGPEKFQRKTLGAQKGFLARKSIRTLLGAVGDLVGRPADALLNTNLEEEQGELDTVMAWAVFDTLYEEETMELVRRAKIWGMLEVPWTQAADGSGTGYENESNYEFQRFKLWTNVLGSYGMGVAGAMERTSTFMSTQSQRADLDRMEETYNAAGLNAPGGFDAILQNSVLATHLKNGIGDKAADAFFEQYRNITQGASNGGGE